jgi:hypothetical protein
MATNQALVEVIYRILSGGATPGAATTFAGSLGFKEERAAAADPQAAWQTIFTIAGGLVAITGLIGVRTVIQAGGASTMQFRHSVGPTVLDNGAAVITGNAVGTIYVLTGDIADPIQVGAAGVVVESGRLVPTSGMYGSLPMFIVGAGNVQVTMTAAAGTGSTRYIMTYIPLDTAATVVAA